MKIVFSLILLGSAIAAAQDAATKPKPAGQTQPKAKPAPTKAPPASPSMQVYRDPVTGEIGGPPPSSSIASPSAVSSNAASLPESVVVTQAADGSLTAILPESTQVQLTVTRNPDGTLAFKEVQGANKPAMPAASNPKPAAPAAASTSEVKK